jgi:hypothetical protein
MDIGPINYAYGIHVVNFGGFGFFFPFTKSISDVFSPKLQITIIFKF